MASVGRNKEEFIFISFIKFYIFKFHFKSPHFYKSYVLYNTQSTIAIFFRCKQVNKIPLYIHIRVLGVRVLRVYVYYTKIYYIDLFCLHCLQETSSYSYHSTLSVNNSVNIIFQSVYAVYVVIIYCKQIFTTKKS